MWWKQRWTENPTRLLLKEKGMGPFSETPRIPIPPHGGGSQGAFFVQGGLADWARLDPPSPHSYAKA